MAGMVILAVAITVATWRAHQRSREWTAAGERVVATIERLDSEALHLSYRLAAGNRMEGDAPVAFPEDYRVGDRYPAVADGAGRIRLLDAPYEPMEPIVWAWMTVVGIGVFGGRRLVGWWRLRERLAFQPAFDLRATWSERRGAQTATFWADPPSTQPICEVDVFVPDMVIPAPVTAVGRLEPGGEVGLVVDGRLLPGVPVAAAPSAPSTPADDGATWSPLSVGPGVFSMTVQDRLLAPARWRWDDDGLHLLVTRLMRPFSSLRRLELAPDGIRLRTGEGSVYAVGWDECEVTVGPSESAWFGARSGAVLIEVRPLTYGYDLSQVSALLDFLVANPVARSALADAERCQALLAALRGHLGGRLDRAPALGHRERFVAWEAMEIGLRRARWYNGLPVAVDVPEDDVALAEARAVLGAQVDVPRVRREFDEWMDRARTLGWPFGILEPPGRG